MNSYNKINGTYASDNKFLLTDTLRTKWGFEGLVVSDWGGMNSRLESIKAGMDLEMPGSGTESDEELVAAVKNGTLDEEVLNRSAQRVTELILRSQEVKPTPERVDKDHHALAREVAAKSAVLLKNQDNVLPLREGGRIAIIGGMAKTARYQGAGSSLINPSYLDSAFEALTEAGTIITYAEGYSLSDLKIDQAKIEEACKVAKSCETVLVFAGLPAEYESEGFDRTTLSMPDSHNKLIEAVAKVNPNTVVVLQCGAPVTTPWKDLVKGILLMYLSGQAGGGATADLLLGKVNPCGKLAETWPYALEDNPSAKNFPGEPKAVQYRESIYVGYRYYDTAGKEVAFPFGYGLSYTSFVYSNMRVEKTDQYNMTVTAEVTNTGACAGAEIVQLYVHCNSSSIFRAEKELKGFDKVFLLPGESKSVTFTLDKRSFAYYNTKAADWCVEGGSYELLLAASVDDIRLKDEVILEGDGKEALLVDDYKTLTEYMSPSSPLKISDEQFKKLLGHMPPPGHLLPGEPFTRGSSLQDIKDTFIGKKMLKTMRKQMQEMFKDNTDPTISRMIEAMMMDMPLRSLKMMSQGALDSKKIDGIVALANGKFITGIKKMLAKK
jgi:beta-glucosidase